MSQFVSTTVGKKVVMASTGVVLFGFVVAHMLGNLTLYQGAAAMNDYSRFLHSLAHGGGLWVTRAVLLLALGGHIWAMMALTQINRKARAIDYKVFSPRASTYASRTMRWSGGLLLSFIVFHILHLTTGSLHPDFVSGEPFHNVSVGLRVLPVAVFYFVANLALGMHLFHGASSMLQTLGLNHPRYNAARNRISTGLALVVVAGNLSFPLAVLSGFVR